VPRPALAEVEREAHAARNGRGLRDAVLGAARERGPVVASVLDAADELARIAGDERQQVVDIDGARDLGDELERPCVVGQERRVIGRRIRRA